MTRNSKTETSAFARITTRREFGLAVLIALITIFVSFFDPRFLDAINLRDILVRCAPTAIVACGMMLVIVTAEIDISVGSLMALTAAAMGIMLSENEWNLSLWIGLPATLMLGTAVGLLTGLLVTVGKVPSIIVTLGLLTALRGFTTLMMGGKNIDGLPPSLQHAAKQGFWGIPLGVWVAACVLVMTLVIIAWTPLGRRIFAFGSSRYAATMCGLSEKPLKLFVFATVSRRGAVGKGLGKGRGEGAKEAKKYENGKRSDEKLHFQQRHLPSPRGPGQSGVDWHWPVVALRRAEVLQLVADA